MSRLPVRSFAVLAAIVLVIAAPGFGRLAGAGAENTVRLIVDYGDGVAKTVGNLSWSKGITVLDAMKEAATRPHGLSFSSTGSGDGAMLVKIVTAKTFGGSTSSSSARSAAASTAACIMSLPPSA